MNINFTRISILCLGITFLISGCAGLNLNDGYYNDRYNDGYYDDGYYNGRYNDRYRDRYYDRRERDIRDERRDLERERRRLEEERRRRDDHRRPVPKPNRPAANKPRPAPERCPAGFRPSERKCTQKERKKGCKDIRLPGGLGCVKR